MLITIAEAKNLNTCKCDKLKILILQLPRIFKNIIHIMGKKKLNYD